MFRFLNTSHTREMRISVVVTTYNGSKYVIQQLESILNQSIEPDEVLILDDCSNDGITQNLITKFIEDNKLDKWKFSINKTNVGWKRNFVQGIQRTTGEYIFLADQDDVWMNDKVETMVGVMESNKNINLLCSNYLLLDQSNNTNKYKKIKTNSNNIHEIYVDEKFHLVGRPGCTYCCRACFAKKALLAWVEGYPHDKLLWMSAILTNTLWRIDRQLIVFRRHSENSSGRRNLIRKVRLENIILDEIVLKNISTIFKINKCLSNKELLMIKEYKEWCLKRKCFLSKFNIVYFWNCYQYRKYYSSWKSAVADFISK